uniref:Uncharacterized protein n=1 Tax=Tanacetum cinerariifolium TaxID=118510 RepID=A0A6L2LMQ8_TANCI|nr:hypothetical protein [Tanacetum cinerariifolium]
MERAVMSSASSAVTYTSVYTDSEPGRSVASPSPNYIPGPEEPQTPPVSQDVDEHEPMFIQSHDPDYVSEPMYPEYIPLEDEHVLPTEEQPLPPVDSTTDESLGYVAESDPKEDLEEDDANDEDEDEKDEEEEHFASVDVTVVVPTVEPVSLPEGTEPVIPPPSTDITTIRARITIQLQASISLPPEGSAWLDRAATLEEVVLFALSPGYEVWESFTARLTEGRGIDYGFVNTLDAEARRRGIREVGYCIRDTWVDPAEAVLEIAPMTLVEVNTRVTELVEIHEHDTHDLYALLEDAQDSKTRISQRVTMDSQQFDLLMEDMIAHQETILIVKEEAYAPKEAWAHSIGFSQAVHYKLQTHHEQVHETRFQMQQTEMAELRETNRRQIMAPVTRRGQITPPNDTNPNNMTPKSVQAMIDQALL